MKKSTALIIRIIGVLLSMLGVAIFCLLFVLWSVEEYSTYSVPLWPMAFGIGIAVLGLICIKAGAPSHYSPRY
jgi:vacuolar-type H+-ATPase subunit I/STV1